MDPLSIALILLVAWIAIIVVAVALARAAGRADARTDDEMRRLAADQDATREAEPSDERTPLDALADEVTRTNARAGRSEPAAERPAADQSRPAPKRFKRRSRLTARRDQIKNRP